MSFIRVTDIPLAGKRVLIRADLKKKGSDTVLGNLWWVIDPLLQMLVYVVFVTIIFARSTPDYPLFIFAAILPWKWFTSTIYDGITSVVGQERLIKQIQFPKIILPTASTVAGIANFIFGLVALAFSTGCGGLTTPVAPTATTTTVAAPAAVESTFKVTLAVSGYFAGQRVQQYVRDEMMKHALRRGVEVVPLVRPYGADTDTVYLQHVLSNEPVIIESVSALVLRGLLTRNTPYQAPRDFSPIILLGETVSCVAANAASGINSMQDAVEYAKRNPGKLSFPHTGSGLALHLIGESFNQAAGVDLLAVPYKASGSTLVGDFLAGREVYVRPT